MKFYVLLLFLVEDYIWQQFPLKVISCVVEFPAVNVSSLQSSQSSP